MSRQNPHRQELRVASQELIGARKGSPMFRRTDRVQDKNTKETGTVYSFRNDKWERENSNEYHYGVDWDKKGSDDYVSESTLEKEVVDKNKPDTGDASTWEEYFGNMEKENA